MSACKIPIAIFFLLSFSFFCFAEEKVYTNKDLKRYPSSNKVSRGDQGKGKSVDSKDASRSARGLEGIIQSAKQAATRLIHEVKTNNIAKAATLGIVFLAWMAYLAFRFSRPQ